MKTAFAFAGVASLLFSTSVAHAFPPYANSLPNRVITSGTSFCATCHINEGGGSGCVPQDGGVPADSGSLADGGIRAAPCLNPFGDAVRRNRGAAPAPENRNMPHMGTIVWAELAMLDSDGDGFTNGEELQDPTGAWTVGRPAPGTPGQNSLPGSASDTPGVHDADRDHFCWLGRDLNDDFMCTTPEERAGGSDCQDLLFTANPLATEDCGNVVDDDCDGRPTATDSDCANVVDGDGDGYCLRGRDTNRDRDCGDPGEDLAPFDCNDASSSVAPNRAENCTDGVDNNCDGRADMMDPTCVGTVDRDGDGYCPAGRDLSAPPDGDCADMGENERVSDCDDTNAMVRPGATESCSDGLDNDCNGWIDDPDPVCRPFFDEDRDTYCPMGSDMNGDRHCRGTSEVMAPGDCDDLDPDIRPNAAEMCTSGVDYDCDGAIGLADANCASFRDADRDGYCGGGRDLNRDGDCLDGGEAGTVVDCDDTRDAVRPGAAEICNNTFDDDCNGRTDALDPLCVARYSDSDGDGWCVVGRDVNGDGDCADSVDMTTMVGDADDRDATVYPSGPENCLDGKDNDQDGFVDTRDVDCASTSDRDGDGFCALGRDSNADRDCADPGEDALVTDCNDTLADVSPRAAEQCANRRDDDCDGSVDITDSDCRAFLDRDGDGFCPTGVDDNGDGDCIDQFEDRYGNDCDDTRASVSTRRIEVCANGLDDDCDGSIDAADVFCVAPMLDGGPSLDAGLPEDAGRRSGLSGGACSARASAGGHGALGLWAFALLGLAVAGRRARAR